MEFWLFCVILGAVMFFGAAPIAKIKTRNCTRTVEMTIVGAVKHEPDPEDEGTVTTYAPVYHFEKMATAIPPALDGGLRLHKA